MYVVKRLFSETVKKNDKARDFLCDVGSSSFIIKEVLGKMKIFISEGYLWTEQCELRSYKSIKVANIKEKFYFLSSALQRCPRTTLPVSEPHSVL